MKKSTGAGTLKSGGGDSDFTASRLVGVSGLYTSDAGDNSLV